MEEVLSAVDEVAKRLKEDPKIRAITEEARWYSELAEHPAWKKLHSRIQGRKRLFLENLADRLMRGQKVSTEEIEFHRGFYQGAEYVLGHPAQAEANLEAAARVAWLLAVEELERDLEEESPYA